MSRLLGDLPRLFPRTEQTIAGIGRLLRRGEVSCVDILNACLDQVEEWEPKVHAWVVLDRQGAMEQSRALDEELRSGKDRGPIHGIPIGIKDIIDVRGLPTACGARRWSARIAQFEAGAVARLREAGAVIMGKTVTTPYAWIDPPPTRNPWHPDRTPGGSSSGSAAALACGMCYGALGSQTGGSITRPAVFCGVAGMKPSRPLALESSRGVLPLAPSLDHVGPLARTIDDLRWIFRAMDTGRSPRADAPPRRLPPRLVRFRGFFDRLMEPAMRSLFEYCLEAFSFRGAEVVVTDDPVDFEGILKDHRRVMAAEAANVHSRWIDEFPEDYPPRITELVREGCALSAPEYLRARAQQDSAKTALTNQLVVEDFDAIVTPATLGTAPDLSTTGDPAFNSPWSFSGLPTVSFPVGPAVNMMPLGLQLVGLDLHDYELLRTARWCQDNLLFYEYDQLP